MLAARAKQQRCVKLLKEQELRYLARDKLAFAAANATSYYTTTVPIVLTLGLLRLVKLDKFKERSLAEYRR